MQRRPACRQAGFAPILLLVICSLLIVVGGGAYYYTQQSNQKIVPLVNNITPTPQADETSGWKVITNQKFGFSFKYPPSLDERQPSDSASYIIGKYIDPSIPGVASLDYLLIEIINTKAPPNDKVYFVKDADLLMSSLRVGETKNVKPDQPTTGFNQSWIFTRKADVVVDHIVSQVFVRDSVLEGPKGSHEKIAYFKRGEYLYLVRGYIVGGYITDELFNQILSTFKFLDNSTSDISNWKAYSGSSYSLEYPPNWSVREFTGGVTLYDKNSVYYIEGNGGSKITLYKEYFTVNQVAPLTKPIGQFAQDEEDFFKANLHITTFTVNDLNAVIYDAMGEGSYGRDIWITNKKLAAYINSSIDSPDGSRTENQILATFKFK